MYKSKEQIEVEILQARRRRLAGRHGNTPQQSRQRTTRARKIMDLQSNADNTLSIRDRSGLAGTRAYDMMTQSAARDLAASRYLLTGNARDKVLAEGYALFEQGMGGPVYVQ